MGWMKGIWKSRKFWAAVVAIVWSVLIEACPNFPISEEAAANAIWAIVAYILGVAIEDSGMKMI